MIKIFHLLTFSGIFFLPLMFEYNVKFRLIFKKAYLMPR